MKLYDTDEFRATKQWPYAVCAGCVVYRLLQDKVEILLLERNAENDLTNEDFVTYHLPKGHIRFSEPLLEAAIRETLEELGCEVKVQTYLGAIQKEYIFKGINYNRTFHFFAAEWQEDVANIDDEHDSRSWVTLEDAAQLLGPPNPKGEDELIKRFTNFLELTNAT